MPPDIIEILDEDDREEEREPGDIDRRAVLTPIITRVVNALGGLEGDTYQLGDEAYGCLKDLKKLWRKDDTDDDRTVARIFWETRVLSKDLIPILTVTAGQGLVEDKRAIASVDLMTAMTWPIDIAEELKELDDELDKTADYTQLLDSHLAYKAALLKPGVMKALFNIMLPPLAKKPKEREERDGQILNVVLHLFRNLAFIKDPPANTYASSDQAELSTLQSKLIRTMEETHVLRLLLTIAANVDHDPLFNNWNSLVLEIFYLLFRGVKPATLAQDQAKEPTANLQRLLALEDRNRRDAQRKASSRHSRFGTTIQVRLNPSKSSSTPANAGVGGSNEAGDPSRQSTSRSVVLHRQQAIHAETGSIMDITKRQKAKKATTIDPLTHDYNLSVDARVVLQKLAIDFLEGCFNPFLSGLLKDIRSERAKVTEKDNLRLLYVTKWFLEFFLTMRSKESSSSTASGAAKAKETKWDFGLIAEITERVWIVWVLKRMREAMEEKPKLWTELQAGIECLTQLLLLIDRMASSEIEDAALSDAADILQQQLVYNGEVLDIALDSLRTYKEGTQSLAYLDSSVHLSYALLRMLEKWSKDKGDGTYVRKKAARRKRAKKGVTEEEGIPDVEEPPEEPADEDVIHETLFTFESFEMVSTLDLFKSILADQKSFPREQAYKDLVSLVNYILRKFFKALQEEPFLAIEVFFPKNRGNWKQYSSWEPEEKAKKDRSRKDAGAVNVEVAVKKGYSWSDQIGIAIAVLVDGGRQDLVIWTQEILKSVIDNRNRIVNETDQKSDDEDEADEATRLQGPSAEAISKFEDEDIPYLSNDHAEAATKNPHLKLLFRLCKFFLRNADADEDEELEWYIPQAIVPSELQQSYNVIGQFLETPFDSDGKKVSELLRKKRARRRRRRSPSISGDEAELSDEPKPKKKKKEKEQAQYKSAQFIQDSDEEYGDMEAFLEKERLLREKAVLAAAAGGNTDRPIGMKTSGTKKRRRKNPNSKKTTEDSNRVQNASPSNAAIAPGPGSSASSSDNDSSDPDNNLDSDNDARAPHTPPTMETSDEATPGSKQTKGD
ncbi:hypothetical protein EST38_g3081 [Candolleomyces aberdarensis]|uniref:Timeless N-terminal domain-containing protein n=1 Tax=Candolleomyces aberdarensis TaxID=2316362 RepID=A0A4Q2DV16_9AGAR|nr:hypothetical protein EST38_g3081 [Candolleomyces aberdarensis]